VREWSDVEVIRSPLEGVEDEPWTEFVGLLGNPKNVSREALSGHLGLFLFHPLRLSRLGITSDGKFLRSPAAQYRALVLSFKDYEPLLKRDVTAQRTLSGLLGVAHRAGLRACRKWIRSDEDKANHPFTTSTFELVNGIF
jgi:hypothetical protein